MEERHSRILEREEAALLVVDVQERLWAVMQERQRLVDRIVIMIKACQLMKIPIYVTEQYPKGLGATVSPVKQVLGGNEPLVKMTFSCCGLTRLPKMLKEERIEQVIIVGIESHVCVLQTALDLVAHGFQIHVPRDAVSSRHEQDERTALQRLAREGVVITTVEMALFELLRTAEALEFKEVSRLIR